MSTDTISTIYSLNEAFIQETATATATATATETASVRPYEYCQCYGTFVADLDKPDIDSLIYLAQEIHGPTESIIPEEYCPCPVCVGHLGQCEECDGLHLVKDEDETEEYDEYEEEELRGSPIDFVHEPEFTEKDEPVPPITTRLFMDVEEVEESMSQVSISSGHAR